MGGINHQKWAVDYCYTYIIQFLCILRTMALMQMISWSYGRDMGPEMKIEATSDVPFLHGNDSGRASGYGRLVPTWSKL